MTDSFLLLLRTRLIRGLVLFHEGMEFMCNLTDVAVLDELEEVLVVGLRVGQELRHVRQFSLFPDIGGGLVWVFARGPSKVLDEASHHEHDLLDVQQIARL